MREREKERVRGREMPVKVRASERQSQSGNKSESESECELAMSWDTNASINRVSEFCMNSECTKQKNLRRVVGRLASNCQPAFHSNLKREAITIKHLIWNTDRHTERCRAVEDVRALASNYSSCSILCRL